MRTIKVKLSPQSVMGAIKEINEYKAEVERKSRVLVQRLVDYGANIAKVKIISLDAVDTGELLSGVDGYYSPTLNVGFVRVTSDHVAFVEFGTGVKGQKNQHQNDEYLSKASWGYATGQKIFTTKDGRIGWIFPTDDGGFRFTEGMKSRPFMYETALELQREFPRIVKEVFGT